MNTKRAWDMSQAVSYADRRACYGKVGFPSRKNAAARARSIGKGMGAYRCPSCRRWHIGHPRYAE